jgi:hypothetical protein
MNMRSRSGIRRTLRNVRRIAARAVGVDSIAPRVSLGAKQREFKTCEFLISYNELLAARLRLK